MKQIYKQLKDNRDINIMLERNKSCEQIIQDKLSENNETYNIGDIPMKFFGFPKLPELKAYYSSRTGIFSKLPGKGTLEENMGGFAEKMIFLAHSVQSQKVLYDKKEVTIDIIGKKYIEEIDKENQQVIPTNNELIAETIDINGKQQEKEIFCITNSFANKVQIIFDKKEKIEPTNEKLKEWQTKLESARDIFKERMNVHKQQKVPINKQNHWVWDFCFLNLDQVVAIMIIMQHLNEKLRYSMECCLLKRNSDFDKIEENKICEKEGCYLFKVSETNEYIRSGKVIGRTFKDRFKEHKDSATAGESGSNYSQFYTKYPSENCESKDYKQEIGYFEDLDMVCALGFSRNNASNELLCEKENGIFLWNEKIETNVNNVKFRNAKTLNEKKLNMIGYLLEIFYDVALKESSNVSTSPGFETPLGVFGGNNNN